MKGVCNEDMTHTVPGGQGNWPKPSHGNLPSPAKLYTLSPSDLAGQPIEAHPCITIPTGTLRAETILYQKCIRVTIDRHTGRASIPRILGVTKKNKVARRGGRLRNLLEGAGEMAQR